MLVLIAVVFRYNLHFLTFFCHVVSVAQSCNVTAFNVHVSWTLHIPVGIRQEIDSLVWTWLYRLEEFRKQVFLITFLLINFTVKYGIWICFHWQMCHYTSLCISHLCQDIIPFVARWWFLHFFLFQLLHELSSSSSFCSSRIQTKVHY